MLSQTEIHYSLTLQPKICNFYEGGDEVFKFVREKFGEYYFFANKLPSKGWGGFKDKSVTRLVEKNSSLLKLCVQSFLKLIFNQL